MQWYSFPAALREKVALNKNSILLETARFDRQNFRSYVFESPLEIHSVYTAKDLTDLLKRMDTTTSEGYYCAGYFGYECGYLLHNKDCSLADNLPHAVIAIYDKPIIFNHRTGACTQPLAKPARQAVESHGSPLRPDELNFSFDRTTYLDTLEQIKKHIANGETYQINLTGKFQFPYDGSAISLYHRLLESQPTAYIAWLNLEHQSVISFSPELFFRRDGDNIYARPMKGTARRGRTTDEDERLATVLAGDEKSRAENMMIVDLLRNDLGRICRTGSISVPDMFSVERYRTVLQMTSTISGQLKPQTEFSQIFNALFPCGSVTGAPKIRSMEIIKELELHPRGVYTGAIGFTGPNKNATFSVAIRTITLTDDRGEMGSGGGIVWDSDPETEWSECQLKAGFLTTNSEPFSLIESLRWENGCRLLSLHLDRIESSATYFGFSFDRQTIKEQLLAYGTQLTAGKAYKLRLELSRMGTTIIEHTRLETGPREIAAMLAPIEVSSRDTFLYHKTTNRDTYEAGLMVAKKFGCDDVIFVNKRGEITEGATHNIFIEKHGKLYTPPIRCGLLAGIYRRHLLEIHPKASEQVVSISDLKNADAVYACNAVRGVRKVNLVQPGCSPD